jgi:predicted transcriptional regulator
LRIMAAVRRGRVDSDAGRTKTHEQVQNLLKSWASEWITR